MGLDLIHNGNHSGSVDEGIDCVNAKVGNTDGLGFGLWESNHRLPGIEQSDAVVNVDVIRFVGVKGEEVLARGPGVKSNRPVDDCLMVNFGPRVGYMRTIEIKVVSTKLL